MIIFNISKCLLAHILFNYLDYHDIKNCLLANKRFNVLNNYQKNVLTQFIRINNEYEFIFNKKIISLPKLRYGYSFNLTECVHNNKYHFYEDSFYQLKCEYHENNLNIKYIDKLIELENDYDIFESSGCLGGDLVQTSLIIGYSLEDDDSNKDGDSNDSDNSNDSEDGDSDNSNEDDDCDDCNDSNDTDDDFYISFDEFRYLINNINEMYEKLKNDKKLKFLLNKMPQYFEKIDFYLSYHYEMYS